MLFRTNKNLLKGACLLLCSTILFSCADSRKRAPGGHDMPDREKLPDNHILNLGEDIPLDNLSAAIFPFATTTVTLEIEHQKMPFTAVALRDAAADEKAITLVEQYRPLASPFIKQWASLQTGVLIDLRSNGENTRSSDFIISASGKTFPVVFIWDDASRGRLNEYTSILQQIPGIQAATARFTNDSTFGLLPAIRTTERSTLQDIQVQRCFR